MSRILFCLMALFLSTAGLAKAQDVFQIPVQRDAADWERADELLAEGKADEAYPLYAALLARHPGHNALLLGQARAAAALGRPQEAAAIYNTLLQRFPDEPTIRLKAADAERALGNTARAEHLAEAPPTFDFDVARLALFEPRRPTPLSSADPSKRTIFTGRLRAGLLYDSNANQGPASETFSLGNMVVTVPGAAKRETLAAYFGANFDLQHRLDETGPWVAVADARLFVRGNGNSALGELKAREWQWGRLGGGLRYAQDDNFFEVRLKGEIFNYEFNNSVVATGPELTYIRAVTPNLHLVSQAWIDWRNYTQDSTRNGFYGQAGEFVRVFFGERRHSFLVGGKYVGGSAVNPRFSYNGWEATTRLGLGLTRKVEVSPHVSFTQEHYRRPATVLESRNRKDGRLRAGVDVIYRLSDAWSLEANYMYVNNRSRSALYRYNQHVIGCGMSWGF